MEQFILDANLFFNTEAGFDLGKKTNEIIKNLIYYQKKLNNKISFLMPPTAVDELLSFFEEKDQTEVKKFLSLVNVCSPDRNKQTISTAVVYQLIKDVRKRNYQALNLGEEEIIKGAKLTLGLNKNLSKKEFEEKVGLVIKNFRQRFRKTTRFGFIDSITDLDLIVLTKETNGFLVSADEGVIRWARVFGVKEMVPQLFRFRLEHLLHQE